MTPLLAYRLRRDFDGSFETVYKNHVRDVYGFSLSLLGNADDAEDVTQTTFLNAYRALKRGEEVRNLRAWLFAIAHNVCRQRFRTAARRPQTVELDPDAAEAYVDEDAPTAEEIRKAMAQLNFNQRTVLVLREIEGLTYEEIAHAMGLSLSAVETLLFRARTALREQLEAADNDLGCDAVQRLISLQLDGKLSRQDKGLLRAHLRTCGECARIARSQRARKRVMPGLIAVPLPAGLTGAFGGGSIGFATSKVAAIAVAGALVGAGALVETNVVPVAGKKAKASESALVASGAGNGAEFQTILDRAPSGREADAARAQAAKKKKQQQRKQAKAKAEAKKAAAAPTGGSGGSGTTSGSGGSSGVAIAPPPAPAPVQDVVGAVKGVVNGAKNNLPALPVSPPIEVPSLPPVQLPGTGSLP